MTITGTNSGETLTGTIGDDVISALGGNDIINGSQGTDYVDGGAGGGDRLFMTTGDASLFAAATGALTYTIGASSITDSSGTLNTSFTGVERIVFSNVGNGDFNDTIDASGLVPLGAVTLDVRLGDGDNIVTGSQGNDRIFTGFGSSIVDGGAGNDIASANINAANDVTVIFSNAGGVLAITANGETNQFTNVETVLAQGVGSGTVTLDASGYSAIPGVLLVLGGHDGSDVMIGSTGSDLFGNGTGQHLGNDVYTGNGGADIYDYTFAADSMNGDTITDFDIDDVIDLSSNNLEPGGSPLLCNQFIGNSEFSGVAGQYRYTISGGQTLIQLDGDGDGVADQTLTIANGSFALGETFAGSNVLHMVGTSGGGGDDFLVGGTGDDSIYAQGGNDLIAATKGTDYVDGGDGFDQLRFVTGNFGRFDPADSSRTYTISDGHVGDSSGTIDTSFAYVESIFLSTVGNGDYGDTVDASGLTWEGLILRLGAGNDTVIGGGGGDNLALGTGINSADGGDGYDTVYAYFDNSSGGTLYVTSSGGAAIATVNGVQIDSIVNAEIVQFGGFVAGSATTVVDASGYDALPGVQLVLLDSNGSDVIIGSSGNDFLANVSGHVLGSDTFTGNGGADIFDWTYASDNVNGDVITDLDLDDTLDFRFNDGNVAGASPILCNQFIGNAAFSGVAGQYRYTISGGQTLIQLDGDGDGVADQTMTIANGAFALAETSPGSNILHIVGASGTSGIDTLTGTLGDDSIYAQAGNDIINGSQGTDYIDGGPGGGDRLFMTTGDASLFTAATGARTYTIGANSITDSSGTLNTTFTGIERIVFSNVGNGDFNDTIDASGLVSLSAVTLDVRLGDGDNIVTGSQGNDRIFTGFGGNIVDGGGGYDYGFIAVDTSNAATVTITNVGGKLVTSADGVINTFANFEDVQVFGVGPAALTLDATGYTDVPGTLLILAGHNGTDIMIGSAGNDFFANVTGQVLGSDVYTGNGGADIYDYTYAADSMNGDTITDFDIDDVIDFRFNNLEPGGSPLLCNHFIGAAAFTGTAGEYRYQINGAQTVIQLDSNGDGSVDQTVTISNGGFMLAETAPGSNILTLAASIDGLDGVVADGYIEGATLFIDTNGNKQLDDGEASTVTGPGGSFALNVNQAGTIVAIGGINADTGLANTMTLQAPSDSGVVNPLTTLVEAVIEASGGTTSAGDAADQVLAALGLDPALDLLNLDLLGQGSDASALDAQKAAAMIANLVSAAEGATGAGANTESALVGALAHLVADSGPGTVDLTNAATLTPLLVEALPGVTNVAAIATEAAAESQTIAAATSLDGISDAQLNAATIDYSLDNILIGDAGDNHLYGFGGHDTLSGLGGNDILDGGSGVDFLWGGSGNDIFVAENSASKVPSKLGALSMDVVFDFSHGDKIDLRNIDANAAMAGNQHFNFKGSSANKAAADLSYKVYDSVNGAEKALGHDIDGIDGASHYSGPVTIVFGNVDGGNPDFAIALIGVSGVSQSDFLFV